MFYEVGKHVTKAIGLSQYQKAHVKRSETEDIKLHYMMHILY